MRAAGTEAVVFDFDGVLVESTEVKTRAFAALYRQYGADAAERAVAYHLANTGISRYVKFQHLHRAILGIELSQNELEQLGQRFSQLVKDEVVKAPWVAGAHEFVAAHHETLPLFVASGTPDSELNAIVAQRGMRKYFCSVHGSPATKCEIIAGVVQRHRFEPGRVLMIGDSIADYEGALEVGVRFLGVAPTGARTFPDSVAVLPDLTGLNKHLDRVVP